MQENLCKKEKTVYTKELIVEEMRRLAEGREERIGKPEYEQTVFERLYIKSKIGIIREAFKKEVEKTIKRVSEIHELDRKYVEEYMCKLRELNGMWLSTNDKLEMAVDEEFDLNILKKASEDMCEMACAIETKDFRTYNMLPIWDVERQTMGLPLAIQNYELVIDDYLNTLGSEGMKKFKKNLEGYATRENIDSKFERCLERAIKDPGPNIDLALRYIKEGAYVDLKLEGEGFDFPYKPCTALSYLLMKKNKQAVVNLLKYGANVNFKIITEQGETFIPIVYVMNESEDYDLVNLMIGNGARIDKEFLGINILEKALQTKSSSLIMKLLNDGIDDYKDGENIAKLVKNYLMEAKDEEVIVGLYDHDIISLEDMVKISKSNNNAILTEVVSGLKSRLSLKSGRSKIRKLKVSRENPTNLGLKDRGCFRFKRDIKRIQDIGLINLSKCKREHKMEKFLN
ncbi:MAG: hypothetical protein J6Y29_06275 [Clostridiales bacterium]|nr:hypothetical protein [Clostridiales bacterium]